MFGLFKKPDIRKTTNQCLEVWNMLSERDKKSSAQNILRITEHLKDTCNNGSSALMEIGSIKQSVISKFGLRDHVHPGYMQVQILSDFIFSKSQNMADLLHSKMALDEILTPLTNNEKEIVITNLDRF